MNKSLIAISCLLALGLSACGGSSSSSDQTPDVPTQPTTPSTAVDGIANKGIVIGGSVTACDVSLVTDGVCPLVNNDQAVYWQQTVTDENGQYQLDVYEDTPVLITINAASDGTTQMKCDVVECTDVGGATVGFGEVITVNTDFSLAALVSGVSGESSSAHITALTTIAADVAIEAAGSEEINAETIEAANTAVQTAFGLTKPINSIGGIDLTDPDAVANADADSLQASLYSATVLQSGVDTDDLIISDNGSYEIDPAVAQAIQSHTEAVVGEVEEHVSEIPDAVEQQIDNQQDVLQDAIDNGTQIIVVDDEVEAAVDQAKAFVADVRTAYRSVQDDGDLTKGLDDFATKFDTVADLVQADTDNALAQAGAAIDAAVEAFDEDATGEYLASNGYLVTIVDNQYQVSSEFTDAVITLVNYEFEEIEQDDNDEGCLGTDAGCEYNWSVNAELDLQLESLTAQAGNITLTAGGFVVVDGYVESETEIETTEGWSEAYSLNTEQIAIRLGDAEIAHAQEGTLFSGAIELEANGIELSEQSQHWQYESDLGYGGEIAENERLSFEDAELTLNGELTVADESVGIYFAFAVDNAAGLMDGFHFHEVWDCVYESGACSFEFAEESLFEETEDSFLGATALVRFNTELIDAENNAAPSQLELAIDRNAFDAADLNLTVSYAGVDTIIQSSVGLYGSDVEYPVIIRNTSAVVATIDVESEELSGVITVDGEPMATIEETSTGTIVRYKDGYMESVF